MSFVAPYNDKICASCAGMVNDFVLDAADQHFLPEIFKPGISKRPCKAIFCGLDLFVVEIHGRKNSFAHGLDRREVDNVDDLQISIMNPCKVTCTLHDLVGAISEVDGQ